MDLVAAWLLYPALALAVCGGIGLLVERAAGAALPGVLILPVGMAGVIVASQLTTAFGPTARLTVPFVVVLAVAGYALGGVALRKLRVEPWAAAAALAAFAVLAGPIVLSGHATFAGYTILGDTSVHFIGADALLEHGRDFSSLPPSSYEYSLVQYYGVGGYPSGGPTAAGALTTLALQDVAWTFQAFLALLVAMMGLALWHLVRPVVESRALRAVVVFIASVPALVCGYALQGSVKEIGSAYLVALVAALVPVYLAQRPGVRRVVPLAVASSAAIAVVGAAAGVWLAPLLLAACVAGAVQSRRGWLPVALEALGFVAVLAVLSVQSIRELSSYANIAGGVVTAQQELGNLLRPLEKIQAFGIWLTGDYRVSPGELLTETRVLIVLAAILAVVGVVAAVRRRAWSLVLFFAVSLLAWAFVTSRGSPWADGKALMIVSPAVVLASGVGAAWLASLRPALGVVAAGLLAIGILGSDALAYHAVSLAPRDRMSELDKIGQKYAGQGPTLYTEFEEFAKHFLRDTAPEGSSEGWQRRYALVLQKVPPRFGFAADTDQFTMRYLLYYRTLVIRRGSETSRPPSIYKRTFAGRFYDVWQRPNGSQSQVLDHLSLGGTRQPSARPEAKTLGQLAQRAEKTPGARLAYAERPPNLLYIPASGPLPRGWAVDPIDSATIRPSGPGLVRGAVTAPRAGRYDLWVEGSFGRGYAVFLDGRRVGDVRYHLNGRYVQEHVATVNLRQGRNAIELLRPGGDLRPGNGGLNRLLGPVTLSAPDPSNVPVRTLAPDQWRELRGRSLDWVEIVR